MKAGCDPNAKVLATPPGPSPTYGVSAGRASSPTRQVIYDQHRRLIRVVITDTSGAGVAAVDEIRGRHPGRHHMRIPGIADTRDPHG
jgi:hypothetical protein